MSVVAVVVVVVGDDGWRQQPQLQPLRSVRVTTDAIVVVVVDVGDRQLVGADFAIADDDDNKVIVEFVAKYKSIDMDDDGGFEIEHQTMAVVLEGRHLQAVDPY
jgi:hypothetical protein